jgi:hypothetical protein
VPQNQIVKRSRTLQKNAAGIVELLEKRVKRKTVLRK